MWPHRWQPTRLHRPWDYPGKNTGAGCHFLLQCVKVKSLSRVWLFMTPWTAAYQAPPSMRFSRQEYWSGVPLPSPEREGAVDSKCVAKSKKQWEIQETRRKEVRTVWVHSGVIRIETLHFLSLWLLCESLSCQSFGVCALLGVIDTLCFLILTLKKKKKVNGKIDWICIHKQFKVRITEAWKHYRTKYAN